MKKQQEIKKLEELLQLEDNKVVVSYLTNPLTAAGENYGSLMLTLEVLIKNKSDNSEEVLKLVAKLSPPNEWIKKMFNIPVTFKKESGFYNVIVPTLQQFQSEQGVNEVMDSFPKCFGSRISLNPSADTVDDDAVLLLENLKLRGYTTADCTVGFDLETTNLIVSDLARFHAVPIALKMKRPELFEKKLKPFLTRNAAFESVSEEVAEGIVMGMVDVVKSNEGTAHLADVVKTALERCSHYYRVRASESIREPYATITHNDFWTNNTMLKYVDGKAVKNIMVDFQLIEYGSPGADIVFFLFSSVKKDVLDSHYDKIIELYYTVFIDTLKELNCDVSLFTFDKLQEEIRLEARMVEFFHVMIMLRPIYSIKDKVKELSEMTEADMVTTDQLSNLYPVRTCETVLSFAEKNWL